MPSRVRKSRVHLDSTRNGELSQSMSGKLCSCCRPSSCQDTTRRRWNLRACRRSLAGTGTCPVTGPRNWGTRCKCPAKDRRGKVVSIGCRFQFVSCESSPLCRCRIHRLVRISCSRCIRCSACWLCTGDSPSCKLLFYGGVAR